MTTFGSTGPRRDDAVDEVDEVTMAADDLLLDRLGRGEQQADTDSGAVADLLAQWRRALPDGTEADVREPLSVLSAPEVPRSRRFGGRAARAVLAGATATVVAFGGASLAAANAGPDSPLWPVTRVLYPDRAESRTAADAVVQTLGAARAALDQGRGTEADRLLDEASVLLTDVREPAVAQRLRTEVEQLRVLVVAVEVGRPAPRTRVEAPSAGERSAPAVPAEAVPSTAAPARGPARSTVPPERNVVPAPDTGEVAPPAPLTAVPVQPGVPAPTLNVPPLPG
ncbi:hypothetical protein SAMN05216266_105238 [Amycolatopsis marina]|uniref:Anti-sigma-D factor RsdA to sigma factor binding region n=1 Tax=Amycolatopsis marina TaxID=490629 RepID=A0A1I0YS63_9PSEU|nr:hypothetical protein [Amycolatopsis marina]SFB15138.1 hypothetical protein SAMN05216266_105238 [Amycolatopsis marina]